MLRRLALLVLCLALGLALARLALAYTDGRWYITPELIAGTHEKPFVLRRLAPWLVAGLMRITGRSWWEAAAWLLRASLAGWLLALWAFARAAVSERAAWLAVLVAPLGLAPFLVGLFVYDPPALALTTLGLALVAGRRWWAYLAVFPVAVLAHEAAGFLIPVFALAAWGQLTPRRLYAGLAWQLGTLALLKVSLAWLYRASPGGQAEIHLLEHYSYLKAYPAGHIIALMILAALVIALVVARRQGGLPPALVPALVLIPIYFGAYVLLGFPGEVRAVMGVYPVLVVAGLALAADAGRRLKHGIGSRRPLVVS